MLTFLADHVLVQERLNPVILMLLAVPSIVKHKTWSVSAKKAMLVRVAMFALITISAILIYLVVNAGLVNVATISICLDLVTVTGEQANVSNVCSTLKDSAAISVKKVSSVTLCHSNVLPAFAIYWAVIPLWKGRQFATDRRANVLACPMLRVCLAIAVLLITGKSHQVRAAKLVIVIK